MIRKPQTFFLVCILSLASVDGYAGNIEAPRVLNAQATHVSDKNELSFVTLDCGLPQVSTDGEVYVDCIRVRTIVESNQEKVCELKHTFTDKMRLTLVNQNWVAHGYKRQQCSTPTMFVVYRKGKRDYLWNYKEIDVGEKCEKTVSEWHWFAQPRRTLKCTSFR